MSDKIREYLDEGVASQDAATLSRLNRSRHEALARAGRKVWWQHLRWPVAAAMAGVLTVTVALPWLQQPAMTASESGQVVELLLQSPDAEMVDEMAFYLSLAE
ncbi:MAG: hypothetical protein EP312_11435 [Gammaproteobacteria bacterium]|nr:MAG: hypothetical protein EP312_11435 [Gammaproteobacteria bacterium]